MDYENLKELIENHPYSIETFADCANVTVDLLEAVLRGEESLSANELLGIARLTGFPYSVLNCPKLILMDNKRYRHRMLINKGNDKLRSVIKAAEQGNRKAIDFVSRHYWNYEDGTSPMWTDFISGEPVSYARYFCGMWKLDILLDEIENGKNQLSPRERITKEIGVQNQKPSKKNEKLSEFLKSVDELQRFITVHGDIGLMWDVFMKLSLLIGEYMTESKDREIRKGEH